MLAHGVVLHIIWKISNIYLAFLGERLPLITVGRDYLLKIWRLDGLRFSLKIWHWS